MPGDASPVILRLAPTLGSPPPGLLPYRPRSFGYRTTPVAGTADDAGGDDDQRGAAPMAAIDQRLEAAPGVPARNLDFAEATVDERVRAIRTGMGLGGRTVGERGTTSGRADRQAYLHTRRQW